MPAYKAPLNDMFYLLGDVFHCEDHWKNNEPFSHCTMVDARAILQEAAKVAENVLAPLNRKGDEEGVRFEKGFVNVPEGFVDAYKLFAEGGWVGLGGEQRFEGSALPKVLTVLTEEIFCSANCAFTLYSQLTAGAAFAINAHAAEEIKQRYLPPMYSGKWAGAMALTEAHSGTDLGLMWSKAEKANDSSYRISGTKIFISGGEQDLTENIVHLVLARLPDAPAGSKGISMFLVPKYLVNEDGSLGERNNFSCSAVEKKMGLHGSSTCVMNYEEAEGYLIGEINGGLKAMFSMMNYERLSMGGQGLGLAQLSYQGAVEYAKERLQGRAPDSAGKGRADPIIQHGDVRRMLMTQKSLLEAGRAFAVYTAMKLDQSKSGDDSEAEKIVALLTPVVKAFLTDLGLEICVLGQQVYGGHGYICESGMEQLVRDVRITQIYEGTNGIQAMDLLVRKVLGSKLEYINLFINEIQVFCLESDINDQTQNFFDALKVAVKRLEHCTQYIFDRKESEVHLPGVCANDYLHLVGYVCFAYMWTRMVVVSANKAEEDFHRIKIATGKYFIDRLLPKSEFLMRSILAGSESTMGIAPFEL